MVAANPFEITKAVDFTDDQIRSTFVDYPPGGFDSFASPASPMAKFLVGGKGGGRTHLMRHYSYSLRKPDQGLILERVRADGYLGIYFRCSGLNSNRFSGKNIDRDVWIATFNFYFDIWLTEYLLNILADIQQRDNAWSDGAQANFVTKVLDGLSLFPRDTPVPDEGLQIGFRNSTDRIVGLRDGITAYRKFMDRSINNAARVGSLDIEILSNPGSLVFAATTAAQAELVGLGSILITFLIDEFENLTPDQQMYINTLLREKTLPTSFLIGSRRWGVKTHRTFSADEDNKKGSEYEWVELESSYRDVGNFNDFCYELAVKRLGAAGLGHAASRGALRQVFSSREMQADDRLGDSVALDLLNLVAPRERKHIRRLYENVFRATHSRDVADTVANLISRGDSPMSEKLAIHRFYQRWSRVGGPTTDLAAEAATEFDALRSGKSSVDLDNFLNLWKNDLLAQIYMDCDKRAPYLGIDRFIEMSGFLPRSFLMTLKYVVQAASVRGQSPFEDVEEISAEAQIAGVLEASQWFLRDARPTEGLGGECERSIRRLGTLFNRIRYSDKPVEVSCVAFSTDFYGVSEAARDVVHACASHSMLIEILGGRKTRNLGSVWQKFQLHPMLSPTYALPIARRGELRLTHEEMNAIFDPTVSEETYSSVMRRRLSVMMAPFSEALSKHPDQPGLF
jgi:hypothetical protein